MGDVSNFRQSVACAWTCCGGLSVGCPWIICIDSVDSPTVERLGHRTPMPSLAFLSFSMRTGYYAGYVASAFTFGRFGSGYPLGYLTDSMGRKPIIVSGLFSVMLFSLAFGLSPTFGFAVGSRFVRRATPSFCVFLLGSGCFFFLGLLLLLFLFSFLLRLWLWSLPCSRSRS